MCAGHSKALGGGESEGKPKRRSKHEVLKGKQENPYLEAHILYRVSEIVSIREAQYIVI